MYNLLQIFSELDKEEAEADISSIEANCSSATDATFAEPSSESFAILDISSTEAATCSVPAEICCVRLDRRV